MAMPTYKEFLKNPIVAILFMSLFAISYLYFDNKGNYKDIIEKQDSRINMLEKKVDALERSIHTRDSVIINITTKLGRD